MAGCQDSSSPIFKFFVRTLCIRTCCDAQIGVCGSAKYQLVKRLWKHLLTNDNFVKVTNLYQCQIKSKSQTLRHLHKFLSCQNFGGSLQLASPVAFAWCPNDPKVCPSTLAKFFVDNGVGVEEVFTEIEPTRFSPELEKIPVFDFRNEEEMDIGGFENWVGAAFSGIRRWDTVLFFQLRSNASFKYS